MSLPHKDSGTKQVVGCSSLGLGSPCPGQSKTLSQTLGVISQQQFSWATYFFALNSWSFAGLPAAWLCSDETGAILSEHY
jgi:hypothetical protein